MRRLWRNRLPCRRRLRYSWKAVVDEILLQASDDAPDLVEPPLQFKELLLRDILLVLRYAKQEGYYSARNWNNNNATNRNVNVGFRPAL
mgnify:CR=1 FL=1